MKSSIITVFVFASAILFSQDYIYDGKPISETAFQKLYKKCAGYYAMDKNGNVYNVSRFNLKPPKQGDAFTVQGEAKRDINDLIKLEYKYEYKYYPVYKGNDPAISRLWSYYNRNRKEPATGTKVINIYISENFPVSQNIEKPVLILREEDGYYFAEGLLPVSQEIFSDYIRRNRLFRWVKETKSEKLQYIKKYFSVTSPRRHPKDIVR